SRTRTRTRRIPLRLGRAAPYRRMVFGRASDRSHAPAFPNVSQSATLRYSAARRSRKQIVLVLLLVLALDCPILDYENEDDDEDERFARAGTIWTDTDAARPSRNQRSAGL